MKLGVLSDTHGHAEAAFDAVELLHAYGAHDIVHCGDMGIDVLDELSRWVLQRRVTLWWAYGNCDFGSPDASCYAPQPPGFVGGWHVEPADGVAAIHGHDPRTLDRLLDSGRYRFILVGHTHCPSAEQVGDTWILNPGSAARPRSADGPTALLLDLDAATWEWLPLARKKGRP